MTPNKTIQVFLQCLGCRKELNRTKSLDDMELAEKIYDDALINPMIGWCEDCDRKPFPRIEVDGKVVKGVKNK